MGRPKKNDGIRVLDSWPHEFIPITPTPSQLLFLVLPHLRILFGGAAGPGKTIALLAAALQYVNIPGYAALLLRRTYPDLSQPRGLIDRAREWLRSSGATENKTDHRWTFPSGAVLQFGYAQHEDDELRYGGSEYQFIGIDEAGQLTEKQIRFFMSRLRRPATLASIPLRFRLASNPEGPGADYLKREFVDAETRGEDAAYVPARLTDNPHLDVDSYVKSLSHLDPVRRARLLDGDWSVRASGGIFHREWFALIRDPLPGCRRVRSWDLAATDDGAQTVGLLLARNVENVFVVEHVVCGRWTPGKRDSVIRSTAEVDGTDTAIVIEQEPGSGGIAQFDSLRRSLLGYNVQASKPTGDKVVRAGPVASAAEAGSVRLLSGPWTTAFLDALEAFPDSGRDFVDALSQAFAFLSHPRHSGVIRHPEPRERKDRDFRGLIPK